VFAFVEGQVAQHEAALIARVPGIVQQSVTPAAEFALQDIDIAVDGRLAGDHLAFGLEAATVAGAQRGAHRPGGLQVVADAVDGDVDVLEGELGGGRHALVAEGGAKVSHGDTPRPVMPGCGPRLLRFRGRRFGAGRHRGQQVLQVEAAVGAAHQMEGAALQLDRIDGETALAQVEPSLAGLDGVQGEDRLGGAAAAQLELGDPGDELVQGDIDPVIGAHHLVMRRQRGRALGRRHAGRQLQQPGELRQGDAVDAQAAPDGQGIQRDIAMPFDAFREAGVRRDLVAALVVGQGRQVVQFDVDRVDADHPLRVAAAVGDVDLAVADRQEVDVDARQPGRLRGPRFLALQGVDQRAPVEAVAGQFGDRRPQAVEPDGVEYQGGADQAGGRNIDFERAEGQQRFAVRFLQAEVVQRQCQREGIEVRLVHRQAMAGPFRDESLRLRLDDAGHGQPGEQADREHDRSGDAEGSA